MKKIIPIAVLSAVLLICSPTIWAVELSGKIYSKGAPVANITVAVKGTEKKTKTDAEGQYKLDLDAGDYTLIIRGKEYAVKVTAEYTKQDIQLQ
jgi:uncharacterized protein YxeA